MITICANTARKMQNVVQINDISVKYSVINEITIVNEKCVWYKYGKLN